MLRAHPRNPHILRNILQPALQAPTALHQKLDIVQRRKILAKQRPKLTFLRWQRLAAHNLDQIPEIVPAVERDPLDLVQHDQTGGDEEVAKGVHVDALVRVLDKVNAGFGEEVDGLLRVHVVVEGEFEVELPGADGAVDLCECAGFVGEGDA